MNVKLRLLSTGVLFFMGYAVEAQQRPDSLKTAEIQEVVVQGVRTVTKKTSVAAVQTLKGDAVEDRPQANVMNAVQGQLAGVNVTTSTGQPGAKPTVIIRGVGTLLGNTDPLYVIDGFPTNADNFRSLNSFDIESFEVLKDASAIAEYGNRASNGVVVIRTKRGAMGAERFGVRYNTQTGISFMQPNKYNFANSQQLLTLEKRVGIGQGSQMTQEEIDNYAVNTNWARHFLKPGLLTNHNLTLEKSGRNFSSYFSGGYMDQQGILDGTFMNRFTFRSNITGRTDNKKFNYYAGLAVGLSKNSDQVSVGTAGVNQNPILGAFQAAPYISPSQYQNSLQLYQLYQSSGGTLTLSPLFLMDKLRTSYRKFNETRIDGNSELSYKITDHLTVRNRLNAQAEIQRINQLIEAPNSFNSLLFSATPGVPSTAGGVFNGREAFANNVTFNLNELFQADYTRSFGSHTFSLTGSMDYNFGQFESDSQTQRGLNPLTWVPGAGTGYVTDTGANDLYVPLASASKLKYHLLSYIGSFDYDFAKKYGVVASIRRDGSSRFGSARTWGTFWSVGARWNIDEEAFMQDVSFVDILKLRGSYGVVGNQRIYDGSVFNGILPPGFMDIYTPYNNAYNNGLGVSIAFGDPDLHWEPTTTYNIGLDFELLKRRLRGSFDFYNKTTDDMFYDEPQSPTLGALSIRKNTSISLENQGFELNLAYDVFRTSDFIFTLKGNGSINEQTISGVDRPNGEILSGTSTMTMIAKNGYRPYLYYQYHYLGVNPSNGNLLFADVNGNPTENPLEADRQLAKYNHLPKYQGGFGFDTDYRGFYLNSLFTFVAGVNRMDWDLSGNNDPDDIGQFNVSADLLNAWSPTNTGSNIPALNAGNKGLSGSSDRFLVDASYLRLRNVQLGYKIPQSILTGTFVKDMSIYLQGENLVTWSKWRGFDAESARQSDQLQYPSARMFTLGFDVKF